MRAKIVICSICSMALLGCGLEAAPQAKAPIGSGENVREVELSGGRLDRALGALSDIFEINILFSADLMTDRAAPPIAGRLSFEEALARLIEGHELRVVRVDEGTITIVAAEPEAASNAARPRALDLPRLEQGVDPVRREAPVIVTGARAPARTAFESLAPIDVIGEDELSRASSDELLDSLAQSLPGFTAFRFPLNDGNIFNRPTALRGLSSDQTLILVNGRRRHRSAFLETSNGQPVDLTQIPITAIKRVEVLRDGASAQYGSDAIGGVINVILDDDPEASAFAQYSSYYEGDGIAWRGGARGGTVIGPDGFAVISAELFDTEPTSRTRQRGDAIAFQEANPDLDVPDPVQRWGHPERRGWRLGWNSEVPLNGGAEAYLFGTFGKTHGLSDFNWRNPDVASAFDISAAFPDFDLRTVYPVGFTPRFGQDEVDGSAFFGLRGETADGLIWDTSLGYGLGEIDYLLEESINASLGPSSPTAFRPGLLRESELVFNADLTRPVAEGRAAGPGNLAAGLELRRERYAVEAGDLASYAVGPGAVDGLPPGSNGFPGYSPEQAGTFEQDSYAGWVDLEWPVTRAWRLGTAVRYEDYSLFGDTLTGKLSSRYEITPEWVLRATVSTGFRAPTPGQVYTQRTSQSLDTETLDITTRGRFSPVGPVAKIISRREGVTIHPLKAERSRNYSVGLGYRANGLSVTLDAFQIDVLDRFDSVGGFTLTPAERAELAALDPNMNTNISSVGFFQNVYDSRTLGIEAVAAYERELGAGALTVTAAYTTIDTDVTESGMSVSEAERTFFENPVPEHRGAISATYEFEHVEWFARLRHYGEWTDVNGDIAADYQSFGARTFLDLGLTWPLNDRLALKFGIENLFDTYPDEARRQANRGLIYSRNAP